MTSNGIEAFKMARRLGYHAACADCLASGPRTIDVLMMPQTLQLPAPAPVVVRGLCVCGQTRSVAFIRAENGGGK